MSNENLLNKITNLMQSDDSADAPAEAIAWSKDIFRRRVAPERPGIVQRVLAVLQFDLGAGEAAFGERSTGGAAERQMLFAAGETGIDLRVAKTGKTFRVGGQIIGEGFDGATVELANESGASASTAGEFGEFAFDQVAGGKYSLILKKGDKVIEIESIEIS